MTLSSVILSSIIEALETIAKPLNQEEDYASKEDKEEDDASEEDSASEEDNVEEDSASEDDIALVLGGMKTLIEDDALGVKKYNQSKVDADIGPILKARTPDALATRFNKRPGEGTIGKTSDGLGTRYNKRLKEGTIVADESENYVVEIKAKFKANDREFTGRISRNLFKHVKPLIGEIMGLGMEDVSGEDADEINAFEEAFVVCYARIVVKHLTPRLAEFLEEWRQLLG